MSGGGTGPSARRPSRRERAPGLEELLRGWIERMEGGPRDGEVTPPESERQQPAERQGVATRPEQSLPVTTEEPPAPGITPPNGPLPRRFGPSLLGYWGARLAAVAGIGAAYVFRLGDLIDEREGFLPLLVLLGLAIVAGLWSWVRRRGEIEALAVIFEPAGISVQTQFLARRLSWGDLVGLRPPGAEAKGWSIEANVDGRRLIVRLPRDKGWTKRLLDALRGEAGVEDRRFARPRGETA